MVDIDRFKSINDAYGHKIGDKALKSVAGILRENCRSSDLLYRFGGEEFLVLCPGEPLAGLCKLAERLRLAVQDSTNVQHYLPKGLTISLDLTEREHGESLEALFDRCDALLYQAKNNGRNRAEYQLQTAAD